MSILSVLTKRSRLTGRTTLSIPTVLTVISMLLTLTWTHTHRDRDRDRDRERERERGQLMISYSKRRT